MSPAPFAFLVGWATLVVGAAGCSALLGGSPCVGAAACGAGTTCDGEGRCVAVSPSDAGPVSDDDAGVPFDGGAQALDGGPSGDSGAVVDDAGAADSGAPCIDADTVLDDFQSAAPLLDIWDEVYEQDASVLKQAGALRFELVSDVEDAYAVLIKGLGLSGDGRVTMEVVQGPAADRSGQLYMRTASDDAPGEVELLLEGGLLWATIYDVGPQSFPFDPVAHRFWRIVAAPLRLDVQVSPDGVTWTGLIGRDVPDQQVDAYLEVGAGT